MTDTDGWPHELVISGVQIVLYVLSLTNCMFLGLLGLTFLLELDARRSLSDIPEPKLLPVSAGLSASILLAIELIALNALYKHQLWVLWVYALGSAMATPAVYNRYSATSVLASVYAFVSLVKLGLTCGHCWLTRRRLRPLLAWDRHYGGSGSGGGRGTYVLTTAVD
ncbi:uncharacterized protein LOC128956852 [Oppia nitens]|uniref:uncharacterized protein LOC128956852 n=1 Tax=Oppia nitens TaxID=1686743 RepID=UPI0023DC3F31|nr:uncharacterized protein LOC128956852 [Oppia nitens]